MEQSTNELGDYILKTLFFQLNLKSPLQNECKTNAKRMQNECKTNVKQVFKIILNTCKTGCISFNSKLKAFGVLCH